MRTFFIFNNLKVDTWQVNADMTPKDQPLPGFELLTWESESFVPGTLWDLGQDAGYTPLGIHKVEGQIWIAKDLNQIDELEYFLGAKSGLTEPCKVKAVVQPKEDLVTEEIDVIVYRLREIRNIYKIVNDGKWFIKRSI